MKLTNIAVAGVIAGLAVTAVPAEAQVAGRRCGLSTKGGVTQVSGGPVLAGTPGATVTLTCTVQVGAANSTHAGADAEVVSGPPSVQVAVVPPTVVNVDPGNAGAYVCTEADVDGVTYYLDADDGTWSTSNGVSCGRPIDTRRTLPILDETIADANSVVLLLDPLICSVLMELAPCVPGVLDIEPEGDVYVAGIFFWDCPPYAS